MEILFFLSICFVLKTYGQNIVLNGSFELYDTCPISNTNIINDTSICSYWNGNQTPDYYNSCSIGNVSVPQNLLGYQNARTGQGYVGLFAYSSGLGREYVQSQLMFPLSMNVSYCVEFYVSLADTMQYASDKIGIYFSDTAVYPSILIPPYLIPYNPQVENLSMLSDTSNWSKVAGVFLAQGGENIMTLGNFRDDVNTNIQFMQSSPSFPTSYYYIDDVSVEEVGFADAGVDTYILIGDSVQIGNNISTNATYLWQPSIGLDDITAPNPFAFPLVTTTYFVTKTQCNVVTTDTISVYISAVGINESSKDSHNIRLYPNPNNGVMTLECNLLDTENGKLTIYDITGKLIRTYSLATGTKKVTIDVQLLEAGIYLYDVIVNGKKIRTNKMTIMK